MKIHQIRVCVNNDDEILLPEGIHQDGYNMVAIICINRRNITGGINKIYDLQKKIEIMDKGFDIMLESNNG